MFFANRKPRYERRAPLVLINGLAEQAESWYCNLEYWRKHFDVYTPNLLVYDGIALQRRIDAGQPIDIDYLVEQLRLYVDSFVQRPPVHLLANSMGGKIAVEYAARYPDQVARMVLLCPSGLSQEERLPVVEGVRRSDPASLVNSVFQDASHADAHLLSYYQEKFASRTWRGGLMRTLRGTMDHRVADRLPLVPQPTLVVVGQQDRVVNPDETIASARRLPAGKLVVLPDCGHAPQIEDAHNINRMAVDFLLNRDQAPAAPRFSAEPVMA
jgi:pimeloyl-ACP methyl ester carboxylesterase